MCLCRDVGCDLALRFVLMERDEGSLVDPIGEAGGRDEDADCGDGYDDTGLHDEEEVSAQFHLFKIKRYLIIDLLKVWVQVGATMKKRPWRNGPSGVVVTLSRDADLAAQAEGEIRRHAAIEVSDRQGIYLPCALIAENLRPVHEWLESHAGVQSVDVVFAATEPELIS